MFNYILGLNNQPISSKMIPFFLTGFCGGVPSGQQPKLHPGFTNFTTSISNPLCPSFSHGKILACVQYSIPQYSVPSRIFNEQ